MEELEIRQYLVLTLIRVLYGEGQALLLEGGSLVLRVVGVGDALFRVEEADWESTLNNLVKVVSLITPTACLVSDLWQREGSKVVL